MLAVQVVNWDEVLSAPINTVLGHVQTKTIKHSSVRVALLILAPVFLVLWLASLVLPVIRRH